MDTEPIRVLLIGNGGREHALAWKLDQSPRVEKIHLIPGNGGTNRQGLDTKWQNFPLIKADNANDVLACVRDNNVNLVVVGPEAPLVAGIEEVFREAGIRCFGPSKAAAQMEGSKTFAKDFMARHNIPTARYHNFSDYEQARRHLEEVTYNVVLKATGLAGGKGVVIPLSKDEAQHALREMMVDRKFGSAGDEVVIEEYLTGQELSFLSFVDGYTVKSLVPAQDHKQVFDGDQGPNTGGMGCYAPTPIADEKLIEEVHRTILQPTVDGMRAERMPFKGLLFTGIMVTGDGLRVLEYNVRFGDPETQTLLPLMDCNLLEVLLACTDGYLDTVPVTCKPGLSSVTVVACAPGYPSSYPSGSPIKVPDPESLDMSIHIFHAGTSLTSGQLLTTGGRVIATTATASSLQTAQQKAYETLSQISFEGMHYRRDIAHRALHPSTSSVLPKTPEVQQDPLTYASAGVSISTGNAFVSTITSLVASTARPGASALIGGFGGTLDLAAAGYPNAPTLLLGTDGVGTKLRIAQQCNIHSTIGIDLVAMCANDVVVQGAECLAFMDTFSCNKLDQGVATQVLRGVVEGCKQAHCALVGGETAEMGGMYAEGVYDIVGFVVGAIPSGGKILPLKDEMREGDVVLGLASSGCHSNGFSLIQKIVDRSGLSYGDAIPWPSTDKTTEKKTLGETLLTPTKIYTPSLLPAITRQLIKGAAHITGGGLVENIPRALPSHLSAHITTSSWPVPPVFKWLKREGNVSHQEMSRVFNMGIGMVVIVSEENVSAVGAVLRKREKETFRIGRLVKREEGGEGCLVEGMEEWDE